MPVVLVRSGARFSVFAWGSEEDCELLAFLEELENNAHSDYERLLALIERTAEHGPPHNRQQCRALEGERARGLFEFKAPRGARVLWFYDENRVIICSHGFIKKKDRTPAEEIERAQNVRKKYFDEKKEQAR